MHWDEDPLKQKKYMIFDAIVIFINIYLERHKVSITVDELTTFIDKHIENF
jgi:myosin-crossreactive antigen